MTHGSGSFANRLAVFGFGSRNFDVFPALKRFVERFAGAALSDLYVHIRATPEARGKFSSDAGMDRAQGLQQQHWSEMFARPLDQDYYKRAEKIGHIHARIGLSPTLYISSYARLMEGMVTRMLGAPLARLGVGRPSPRVIGTFIKTALLDMEIALSNYFEAEQAGRQAVLEKIGAALDRLANGDFTAVLDDLPPGYERLVADFESARQRIADTLAEVSATAASINTGSAEINAAATDLSHRTEQQAASLEETAAAMKEVTDGVSATARDAANVARTVHTARADAAEGGRVAAEAVTAMAGIEQASHQINQIISVIDGIAFQTNLLALNAGVEAARAGDAGKGFAVGASEVRALAQRSADAARDVKQLIEDSSRQVEAGAMLVGETGKALERIVAGVGEVSTLVERISSSADAQASSLHQVNTAVAEMDGMTQQNAAMVEQSTASSASLAGEANRLATLVGGFRFSADSGQAGPVRAAPAPAPAPRAPRPPRLAASGGRIAVADAGEDWSSF
ncbi:globin-coupled sensor protein [Sphingomonas quercus]|uniref:Globin-coupled sensor protein n=1 Tax=Sphingomonas quercus TaxID=2842451 RepID=A0ABS6BIW2_9SPHN|nr:globin-coupled sensor protein [Sphingomonas quercus]MBU3078255.1 globin-coupled sensor protein [Sphingomonas quercus]